VWGSFLPRGVLLGDRLGRFSAEKRACLAPFGVFFFGVASLVGVAPGGSELLGDLADLVLFEGEALAAAAAFMSLMVLFMTISSTFFPCCFHSFSVQFSQLSQGEEGLQNWPRGDPLADSVQPGHMGWWS